MKKYMVIYPNGSVAWVEIERELMLEEFYRILGCDCLELVRTIVPDVCLIVDESGKVKDPPKEHNELASMLYAGWLFGYDDIAGPAIVVATHLVDGESDWVPLNDCELSQLLNLGIFPD